MEITLLVDLENELVTNYYISAGLEDASGISNEELKVLVQNQLGGIDLTIPMDDETIGNLETTGTEADPSVGDKWKTCTEGCISQYTDEDGRRIKGRGRCKSRCTIAAIIDILD